MPKLLIYSSLIATLSFNIALASANTDPACQSQQCQQMNASLNNASTDAKNAYLHAYGHLKSSGANMSVGSAQAPALSSKMGTPSTDPSVFSNKSKNTDNTSMIKY